MWSEHCSYKSSRVWLKQLPTKGPQVIQGPGENAGVVDLGDGDAVVFKMESHNHPSYIEPYQGAATGVGGIMRDVFTMGARPVANLNALRFGDPDPSQDAPPGGGRGGGHRRLRQLHGRADRGRGDQLRPRLQQQHPGQRHVRRPRQDRQDLLLRRQGRRAARRLRRLQDGPRRHPRRHHGVGRVRRQVGGEAPDRAGGRPLHREAADRGVPGADGERRHRRHPGHGRRRADLVDLGDGRQGRRRHRPRSRSCAAARSRHDRLRDDALREPGAHADDPEAGPRGRGRGDLQEVGPRFRGDRPNHRHGPHDRAPQGRRGGGPAGRHARQLGAALRAALGSDRAAQDHPARVGAGAQRHPRHAEDDDGRAAPLLPALGLGAIRPHGNGRYRAAPRRGRGRGAGARHQEGPCRHLRCDAPLRAGRSR